MPLGVLLLLGHFFPLGVLRTFQGLGLAHLGVGDLFRVHGAVRGVESVDHRQEQCGDAEAYDEGGQGHRLHQRVTDGAGSLQRIDRGLAARQPGGDYEEDRRVGDEDYADDHPHEIALEEEKRP